MNVLRSQVQKKNSQYFDILELHCNLREMNKDVFETGILINPIVVYRIVYENYRKDGPVRYGAGGVPYEPGCLGKTYIVDKGNSRIPAALELGYTHIEGIIDERNTFTL